MSATPDGSAAGWLYRAAKDFGVSTVLLLVVLWYGGRWLERRDAATDVHRAAAVAELAAVRAEMGRNTQATRDLTHAITATWPKVRVVRDRDREEREP